MRHSRKPLNNHQFEKPRPAFKSFAGFFIGIKLDGQGLTLYKLPHIYTCPRLQGALDMADHGEIQYSTAEGNDLPAHEATYAMFLTLTKWAVGFLVVLLILMAYFLV